MSRPKFNHPSEADYADLFDRLGLKWDYEPTTFTLEQYKDGKIKQAFSPDFFLPDLNLYVEVTTARESTRKRNKIRKLHALYPGVRCCLLVRSDWEELFPDTMAAQS